MRFKSRRLNQYDEKECLTHCPVWSSRRARKTDVEEKGTEVVDGKYTVVDCYENFQYACGTCCEKSESEKEEKDNQLIFSYQQYQ